MLNRNNIENEIDQVLESVQIEDYDIELDLAVRGQTGSFGVSVSANDESVYDGFPEDGDLTLCRSMNVPAGREIKLTARTATHRHGHRAIVVGLRINRVDVFKHNLWIMDSQRFIHHNGKIDEGCNGLYHNGTWELVMPTPLFPWIKQGRTERSKVKYLDHIDFGISGDEYYTLLDKIFR
jgi:hypothetical protein